MGLFSKNSKDEFKDPFAKDMVNVCAGQFRIKQYLYLLDYPNGDKRRKKEEIWKAFPVTKTITKEYMICKYVVTQKQWKAVMGEGFNPSSQRGDNLPVTNVSYDDIVKFLKKLNSLTGKKYRLPSEAEWEWAAMGASKDKDQGEYAGFADWDDFKKYSWDVIANELHPVGKKKSNELGLYDMSGNVCEICEDAYTEKAISGEDYIEKTGDGHVVKGSAQSPIGYRFVSRSGIPWAGFRLAHSVN